MAAAPPEQQSPADEAWAILRELFFAARRRFLAAVADVDLHPAQAGALLQMEAGVGMPMHELAAVLGCDNSNVTGIVDRLEARGLVARRPYAQDRRVRHIVLTEAGVELCARVRARMAPAPEAFTRLSLVDQRLLRDVLRRAVEHA
jgi:DNA-binding MarR family transcriptional regulator